MKDENNWAELVIGLIEVLVGILLLSRGSLVCIAFFILAICHIKGS